MISEDQVREQTESHYPEQDVSEEERSQRFIRFLVSDHRGQESGYHLARRWLVTSEFGPTASTPNVHFWIADEKSPSHY